MPYKCSVPACKGNYSKNEKVHIFGFPRDEKLRAAWIKAIPRKDFIYTENSRVCDKHFRPEDIIWESSMFDQKTSTLVTAALKKPKLRDGAIPSVFPGCPSYLSQPRTSRLSPGEKRILREQNAIAQAVKESCVTAAEEYERRRFNSIEELSECLNEFPVLPVWDVISKSDVIMFLKFHSDDDGTPHLKCTVKIDESLHLRVYLKEVAMKTFPNVGSLPLKVSNITEVHNALNAIDSLDPLPAAQESNAIAIYELVIKLLGDVAETEVDENKNVLKFVCEQLKLLHTKPERYRYSALTLVFSSMFFLISPQAYNFVRNSSNIILPHPNTIRRLSSKLSVSPALECEDRNFLSYVRQKVSFLKPHELYVSLMIDEIHIKQHIEYKGGKMAGFACDSVEAASSAFVFMIQSMLSKYKDVVHIVPSKTMTADVLFVLVKRVILGLEEIGFKVVVVITDNNSINRKSLSKFSAEQQLSYVYPHPADSTRPLFYAVDSVHLIKCVRNNWLNQKNGSQYMFFPHFYDQASETPILTAPFQLLKKIYELEAGNLLKYGYTLSRQALWPSNLERQKVNLALQIFNEHVSNSLTELGPKHHLVDFKGTADFIKIFSMWFKIMNVKTSNKGKHKRDVMCEPLKFSENDEKLHFLCNFLEWLDKWEAMTDTNGGKLTRETHLALKITTNCIIELARYCISELGFTYILPGKVQTDELECRFGLYRRMGGTQYHVSIQQIFEIENKMRSSSLMKLSLKSASKGMFDVDTFVEGDDLVETNPCISFHLNVTDSDITNVEAQLPLITYLAGYCAHSVLKKYNCSSCKDNLVLGDKPLEIDPRFRLIHACDRGGLLFPTIMVTNIIVHNYIIVQKLVSEEHEKEFLRVPNQISLVISLTLDVLACKEMYLPTCVAEHCADKIMVHILRCSANTLLKNYCNRKNEKNVHSQKKRKLQTLEK